MADRLKVLEPVPGSPLVRAAGGVVWRATPSGVTEILLVHRPKYGDWSFPKGKCEVAEASPRCALREVEEESGYQCVLGPELPGTTYLDAKGRHKEVRYWAMTVKPSDGAGFAANQEVDDVRWLALADARALLSYERDRAVLDSLRSHLIER